MARMASEIKRRYRNRVLQERLHAGIKTQKELANRSGIKASILCDIESNKIFLSSVYALRIAEELDCTINDLFERRS
jgi:ribosome-binding protein aMBF1 (putative translation factor)